MLDVLQARIADLSDDEMAWAPAPDVLRMGSPAPRVSHYDGSASPVATIGWRLEHIAGGLTDERVVEWLSAGIDAPAVPPHSTADEVRSWVASSADWFCMLVEALGADPRGLMGFAEITSGADHVITVPVRVVVHEVTARGQTSRETLLYQILAHELGHALGLVHTTEPRSLMCCVHASLDFNDPTVRAAYVEARRKPDIGSARAQLAAHYERFWRAHP